MKIVNAKLFHFPATRSARVAWALHETLGDGFEIEKVELFEGKQYSEDFLVKNPNHAVPVLELSFDDGSNHRMLESAAMVEWLLDAFPEKALAPAPGLSRARADYLQMLHFGATWMDMMLWQIRVQEHLLPEKERDQRSIDRNRQKFEQEVEPQLLARLSSSPFVCGEQFTGADIIVGHNVGWARAYGMCQSEVFRAYRSRLAQRPAFQKAFADTAS